MSKAVSRFTGKLRAGTTVKRLRAGRHGRYVVKLTLSENGSKRTYTHSLRF